MTSRLLIAAVVLLTMGCPAGHGRDDAGPPDVPVPDCGPFSTDRDVSVIVAIQSWAQTAGSRMTAFEAIPPVLSAIRERTTGTIRLGVLTTDAGPGGIRGSGCNFLGDDGVLLSGMLDGRTVGPVFSLGPSDVPASLPLDAVITRDTFDSSCMNQVLESVARAITPSTVPLALPPGGGVHGDRENADLFRPGGILLVVMVSPAEDCSWNERVLDTLLPDGRLSCPTYPSSCCESDLYPSADRYVPAFRAAAAAQGMDLAVALLSTIPEADVSLAEWRARGEPELCTTFTTPFIGFPWRVLEVVDQLEPFATTQPECDPNYEAIANLVTDVACATGGDR